MKKTLFISFFVFCFCSTGFSQKEITLRDVWGVGTFQAKGINKITSMKDGEHYCTLTFTGIEKYAYKTGKKVNEILLFSDLQFPDGTTPKGIESYAFSNDETKLLLTMNSEPVYRRSFITEYLVYDLKTKKLQKLSENGKQNLADFSPDGSKVAFIRGNNLFLKDLNTNVESAITNDGKFNHIIYGAVDWVYEEEFTISKGFFWSGNGNKLAFYRFDESKVKEYSMTVWGNLYPEDYKYKYPKAGEDNSVVDVWVYDLPAKKITKLDLGSGNDQYIPRFQWTKDPNTLAVQRMNRLQNKLEILLADANSGGVKCIYTETNPAYIDEPDFLHFLDDNKHFLFTSEKDGYNHIYIYDLQGNPISQLTSGNFDVTGINCIDEKKKRVYYTSAESSPLNRDLYSVDFSGKKKIKLSGQEGANQATFSSNGKYFINNYSAANTPPVYAIYEETGKELVVLQDNAELAKRMKEYGNEHKEFGSFNTSQGIELNYSIIKPADFDSTKKYPVLFYVYGGPGSQTVANSFSRGDYFWFRMLAQKGYIVISVDNRGTGYRGEKFKKCTYLQLGKYETEDQIEAAKYFGAKPWIDNKRIGIFGWSYGGYMSTLCITKGSDYFKTAIAVAPVTNWRYYDNIYTERFMRRPQENAAGYDDNSPINHVKELKGNYLLIHGSSDDNVHLQNTMDLSAALIRANKQFELFIYPNKDHSIYGGNTRLHLYTMMTNFLMEKL